MKIVVPRELIPFQRLLEQSCTKDVFDQALESVDENEYFYSDQFLKQLLVNRNSLSQLPNETLQKLVDGSERLDRQSTYVVEEDLNDDCFLEYKEGKGSVTFYVSYVFQQEKR